MKKKREISRSDGETRLDKRYCISSLPSEEGQLIGQYIRGYWGLRVGFIGIWM
ncbi:hypothetical protein FHS80_000430 [Porphyromonas circumdentaria]|nr:hypothetical protein [Porphyromonas circumdentaria]